MAPPQQYMVDKLASAQWESHLKEAYLKLNGKPRGGVWTLTPAEFKPSKYRMLEGNQGLIREALTGSFYYGEHDTGHGWEPVTIKRKIVNPAINDVEQEHDALMAVHEMLQGQPEPHNISYYLDAAWHTAESGEDCLYIVTRFEEGTCLHDFFHELHNQWETAGKRLELVWAVKECFKQILQGMHVLHGCGWAHVNLKPSKVQIKKAENSPKLHCTVVDLGCSIGGQWTQNGARFTHTLPIVAPELVAVVSGEQSFDSTQKITQAQDMWSLGCLLVYMLTATDAFWVEDEGVLEGCSNLQAAHAQWAKDFKAGWAMPGDVETLMQLIPDREQYTSVAQLLRCLLNPKPECRPAVSEMLHHNFLQLD